MPDFEGPVSLYCSAAEPYVFTPMCRVLSKWCDMVMCVFKEWAFTEFLVVEKGSVTNNHKQFKMYAMSVLLIKEMFVVGLRELQALRKGRWISVTLDDAVAGQQLQLLRHCFSVMKPQVKPLTKICTVKLLKSCRSILD